MTLYMHSFNGKLKKETKDMNQTTNINKIILMNGVVAFLLFFIIIARFSAAYFSYAMIIAALFFFMEVLNFRKIVPNLKMTNVYFLISYISLYGCMFISQLINGDYAGIVILLHWLVYSLSMWIIWYICGSYSNLRYCKMGILLGTLLASAMAISQYVRNPDLLFLIKGTYGYHNTLGAMMMLAIPVLLGAFFEAKKFLLKILYLSVIALAVVSIVISGSRGAMISLMVALLLGTLIILIRTFHSGILRKGVKSIIVSFFVIVMCLIGVYQTQSTKSGLSEIGGERIFMIQSSLEMWNDHKLTGIGISNWEDNYYGEYHINGSQEKGLTYDHNLLTYSLATSGIIGTIGYLLSIISMIIGFYKTYKVSQNPMLILGLFVSFVAFVFHCQVNPDIQNNTIPRFYYALIGLAMAAYSLCSDNKER